MNQLDIALAARSFRDGRALRSANFRHRRLVDNPLTLVLWQLGGEPFSAAALGFWMPKTRPYGGRCRGSRNRDLAFAALMEMAEWFNQRFELPAADREWIRAGSTEKSRARSAPQLIVANKATVEMIGRLGRRLAYLPIDGPNLLHQRSFASAASIVPASPQSNRRAATYRILDRSTQSALGHPTVAV